MAQICAECFFPNCNKHTKFCAYWNTQPHWGELDRHLIAWPDKGKHSQRKHYTPEKEKKQDHWSRKWPKFKCNNMFQCVATFTHCPDLHSILWEDMERTQHLYDSLVVWAGKLNLKNAVNICYAPQNWTPKHRRKKLFISVKKNHLHFFHFRHTTKSNLSQKHMHSILLTAWEEKMRNQWRKLDANIQVIGQVRRKERIPCPPTDHPTFYNQ